jgi:hypothetical protein
MISSIASPHASRAFAANSWAIGRLTEIIQRTEFVNIQL